jgi:hypothetical protein
VRGSHRACFLLEARRILSMAHTDITYSVLTTLISSLEKAKSEFGVGKIWIINFLCNNLCNPPLPTLVVKYYFSYIKEQFLFPSETGFLLCSPGWSPAGDPLASVFHMLGL